MDEKIMIFTSKHSYFKSSFSWGMKKIIFLFISLIIEASFVFQIFAEEKTVIKLVAVDFPPYEYEVKENGKVVIKGIQVDIVKRMFELAEIEYTLELLPFKRGYKYIQTLKRDCLFNFYKNPTRLKIFDYTDPILKNPLMLFIKKGNKTIKFTGSVNDLKGFKIGVMTGYTYSSEFEKARENGFLNIDEASSHIINFKKLINNRLDIYICEKNVGLYTAQNLAIADKIEILEVPLKIQLGHIGIAKHNPNKNIIPKLNEALRHLKETNEYQQYFDKYLK